MRLWLNSIQQQTPAEESQQGPRWKCLPLCGERSQLTGRLSERLGTSVEETVTERRRKPSLNTPPASSSSMVEVWLRVKLGVGLK